MNFHSLEEDFIEVVTFEGGALSEALEAELLIGSFGLLGFDAECLLLCTHKFFSQIALGSNQQSWNFLRAEQIELLTPRLTGILEAFLVDC